ncbi:MAG TPA: ferritin-like domain-containing protein [Baekduia sp.]|nr:ferritin-like domain-containing protein [Baekduia sp.]
MTPQTSTDPDGRATPPDPTIDRFDRGEAAAEATAALRGTTRGELFRRAGLLVGGGAIAAGVPLAIADAQGGLSKRDVEILNYALTLEYLEAAFYAEAVDRGKLHGEAQRFASVVAQHEAAHVQALKKVLGGKAVKAPKFDFQGTTGSQKSFLATAQVLEDTGVSAYQGQAPRIKSDAVLASAGSILAVEARHAAWVRDIIGGGGDPVPAPSAFNEPKTMDQVLAAVKKTGFLQ